MSIQEKIEQALLVKFPNSHVRVVNESHKHAGHMGDDGSGQTHFTVTIVSDLFEEMSRIQRHKAVNEALDDLWDETLHALSIKAKTKAEKNNTPMG